MCRGLCNYILRGLDDLLRVERARDTQSSARKDLGESYLIPRRYAFQDLDEFLIEVFGLLTDGVGVELGVVEGEIALEWHAEDDQ